MMDETEKQTLMRTKWNLLRNLDHINDVVEAKGFPINNHMILEDLKNSLKGLKYIKDIVAPASGEAVVAKAPAKTASVV